MGPDDFTWRSEWMNRHLPIAMAPPDELSDFRPMFEHYAAPYIEHLDIATRRIGAGDDAPPLTWDGGPIEMAFIDCGRTFEVNDAWYRILGPHFVPDRTLVVLQDWRTHEQVPVRWFNQIKDFTDSLGSAFDLVHEVATGGVATFIFRGEDLS